MDSLSFSAWKSLRLFFFLGFEAFATSRQNILGVRIMLRIRIPKVIVLSSERFCGFLC